MRLILLILSLFNLGMGAPKQEGPPLQTVDYVDIDRYLGRWYEIARYPFFFERNCYNVTATYSKLGKDKVRVVNRCNKGSFDGRVKVAKGKASIADTTTNAKLKVKFFILAPSGDYWIIRLGEDYEYVVISEPERRYLWILSRTPTMDPDLYDELLEWLEENSFDTALLTKTPQQPKL